MPLAQSASATKLAMENIVKGIFLGYGVTTKTLIYENTAYKRILWATHTKFDEEDIKSAPADLTPDSRAFWSALSHTPGPIIDSTDEILTPPENFCIFTTPYHTTPYHTTPHHPTPPHPTPSIHHG
jgi:hypothetical protein